ncbi:type IV toxin-antitoxin system AbiEi family antitoxin domain-containing protein [Streptacidiphilus sp. N1-10]|uniref:Type IV toxin-antitoxin system AbiEi family antitoxin domain-containing protein n=1 Tax=Streptacidiphilus jeojiensis TaxID=3229225 RepID=A0ABV6XV14_9ACTN
MKAVAGLGPTFTTAQAKAAGIAPRDLYAWRDSGAVMELSRGVYRDADAPESVHLDLLAVSLRAPAAVICTESALALHELIDDVPLAVTLAVPRGTHTPSILFPPTVVARFDPATFALGMEQFEAAPGEFVPVYSAARSVVDVMRLRHQFGESLALHALGRYVRRSERREIPALLDLARALGVETAVRSAAEAVLA